MNVALKYPSGLYRINLSGGNFEKAGEKLELAHYNSNEMVVDCIDDVYSVSTRKQLVGYEDKDGKFITEAQYKEKAYELTEGAVWDTEDCYYSFTDLDQEFIFRKWKQQWSAKHEETKTKEKVEFKVVDVFESAYSNIKPLTTTMKSKDLFNKIAKTGEFLCSYFPTASCHFEKAIEKYNIDDSRVKMSTHTGLRYYEIDGKYIFDDSFKNFGSKTADTYKNCVEAHEKLQTRIEECVKRHVMMKKMENSKVSFNDSELIIKIEKAQRHVKAIDYKQRGYSEWNKAKNQLNEILDYVFEKSEEKEN